MVTGQLDPRATVKSLRGRSVMEIGRLGQLATASVVMLRGGMVTGQLDLRATVKSPRGRSVMLRAVMTDGRRLDGMKAGRLGPLVMARDVTRLGVMVTSLRGKSVMVTSLHGKIERVSLGVRAAAVMNHACGRAREVQHAAIPRHPLGNYPKIGIRTEQSQFGFIMMLPRFPKRFNRISSIVSHVRS
ncbi:MAG: hypothetical protein ABIT21_04545 [Terrimesophilobacter sp.]